MKEQEQSHFFLLTIRCIGAQLLSGVPSPLPPASARLRPSSHPEAAQAFPKGFSSSLRMVNKGSTDPVISSSRWQHIGKVCSLEHLPVPQSNPSSCHHGAPPGHGHICIAFNVISNVCERNRHLFHLLSKMHQRTACMQSWLSALCSSSIFQQVQSEAEE